MMSGELFEIDVISLNISRKLDLEDHSKMDHSKMTTMKNDAKTETILSDYFNYKLEYNFYYIYKYHGKK